MYYILLSNCFVILVVVFNIQLYSSFIVGLITILCYKNYDYRSCVIFFDLIVVLIQFNNKI